MGDIKINIPNVTGSSSNDLNNIGTAARAGVLSAFTDQELRSMGLSST